MLSIVLPVYNVRRYLENCVYSILSQTYADFELIIIDDGSTDGSDVICDNIAKDDNRIIVVHQQNMGLSGARNSGIKIAKGEYIGFVDSDDWIEPQMFEKLLEAIERSSSDISICRCQVVNPDSTILQTIGYDEEIVMSGIEATKEILLDDKMKSFAWNKIYKRSLFDGIEYPLRRIFEDTATTYKLVYKSKRIIVIPYVGYNYRINENGICKKSHIDQLKNIQRELHNALAFDERYIFAKSHCGFEDVVPICAQKAYEMIRCFIHMLGHKHIKLSEDYLLIVNDIMKSFESKHLSKISSFDKLDYYLYNYSPPLLKIYINIVPYFHKMK